MGPYLSLRGSRGGIAPYNDPVSVRARSTPALSYVAVLLLILVSGSPAWNNEEAVKFAVPGLFAFAFGAFGRNVWRRGFFSTSATMIAAFLVVFALQALEFGGVYPWMGSLILKTLAGGLIIYSVGARFPLVLFDLMFWLSSLSLVFFAAQVLLPADLFASVLGSFYSSGNVNSLLIHTFLTSDPLRNAGPFWEPGAFQGFLNITYFLLPGGPLLRGGMRLRGAILLVALLTTFSTAGYLAFAALFVLKSFLSSSRKPVALALALLIVGLAAILYERVDFLGPKIRAEIEFTEENRGAFNPSRSGAFLFDLHYIEKHPIIGNGFAFETRFADNPELANMRLGHGNGFSGFLAAMGVLGMGGYYLVLWRCRYFAARKDKVAILIAVTLLTQGQHFLLLPLFLGLPFIRKETN